MMKMSRVPIVKTIAITTAMLLLLSNISSHHAADPEVPDVTNTQAPGESPPSAQTALRRMTLPEGFQATLFAAEPDVRQPIDMTFDDRGRLWVVECYSYSGSKYEGPASDRILIFEDTSGDGRFDRRQVFWSGGQRVTSLELGFGGVFVTAAPHLLFIPDRNRDDVPDGEPVVLLDGWNVDAEHNAVNGLTWGPDGWLYGRHGIKKASRVGKPGEADENRIELSCCIWRFHPIDHTFEVVADGTVNPWGLDFDDMGEAFFTTSVVDHLWHLIPGAHYQRREGQDVHSNPHVYQLIPPTSDHKHWSGGSSNTQRKDTSPDKHDEAGGGHSHCGAMIYLGDNWPAKYRGTLFTCNVHGHRVNNDQLERRGSGFVGRHRPDFLRANDDWFRGVTILYGPDGGVFLSDWSDLGECHDRDGIHRTSGRIYKITHGKPRRIKPFDLQTLSNKELVALQTHKNDWYVRHARRILHERGNAKRDMQAATNALHKLLAFDQPARIQLRALWSLNLIGDLDESDLLALLDRPDEHVRAWSVRLLCDRNTPSTRVLTRLTKMAAKDESALVRLYLAAMLQRIPVESRWPLGRALALRAEEADDLQLPLMIWYGMEPVVAKNRPAALSLLKDCRVPLVRQFIARRLASTTAPPKTTPNKSERRSPCRLPTSKPSASISATAITFLFACSPTSIYPEVAKRTASVPIRRSSKPSNTARTGSSDKIRHASNTCGG